MRNVEGTHYVGFIRINIDVSDMKGDLQRNLLTKNSIEVLIEFVAAEIMPHRIVYVKLKYPVALLQMKSEQGASQFLHRAFWQITIICQNSLRESKKCVAVMGSL